MKKKANQLIRVANRNFNNQRFGDANVTSICVIIYGARHGKIYK